MRQSLANPHNSIVSATNGMTAMISDRKKISFCKITLALGSLPCNLLDDDLLRMLLTGLVHNQTVTYLDLSHNKITDYGAKLLTKVLDEGSVVMTLDLADNQVSSLVCFCNCSRS